LIGFTGSTLDRADHLRLKPDTIAQFAPIQRRGCSALPIRIPCWTTLGA
jgi:hypothetical protein